MHNLVVSLFAGRPSLCIQVSPTAATEDLYRSIADAADIPLEHLTFKHLPSLLNGECTFISANLRLLGGKGGFGSMLRAQGGRMASQKTTNFEACRDLTGRRLKTVNEAKKLADYLEKEPERQKAKEQKLREKIETGLKVPEPKKHRFDDPKYFEQTAEMGEDVSTAVLKVLKKSKTSSSSSTTTSSVTVKPSTTSMGIWDDQLSSSDEDEDEDEKEEEQVPKNGSTMSPPTDDSETNETNETPKRKRKSSTCMDK